LTDFPCCVTCSIAIALLFFFFLPFFFLNNCSVFGHQEQESLPVLSRGGWEVKSVFFLNKKIKQSKKYLKNNKVDAVTCDIKKIFIFLKYFMNSVICPFFLITVLILFFLKKKNLGNQPYDAGYDFMWCSFVWCNISLLIF